MNMTLLVCLASVFINATKQPFLPTNGHDIEAQENAAKRCPQIYKNSQCLTRFTKIGYNRYLAICGNPKE